VGGATGALEISVAIGGVMAVQVEDGSQKLLSSHKFWHIGRIAWLGDSSGLIAGGQEQPYGLNQIWHISYPGGETRRITNDLSNYRCVGLTADSSGLVTVRNEESSSIWIAPSGDASRAKQITPGIGRLDFAGGVCWTPDGKIAYTSSASGKPSIWITEADGSSQKQLTDDTYNATRPSVSPDGGYIVFGSDRSGFASISRIDVSGGNFRQLTNGGFDVQPDCSPDGQWVVYTSVNIEQQTLWKVSVNGGDPRQLTNKHWTRGAVISPDGKLMACWYWGEPNTPLRIALIPSEGGEPIKVFDLPLGALPQPGSPPPASLRWAPDGSALLYINTRGSVSIIWSQTLDGSPPRQVTDFKSERILSFDWSRDGKQLALARGTQSSDVVLISNFR